MKKSILTIPFLLIATVVTIFLGRQYAASQQDQMTSMQLGTDELKVKDEEVIDEEELQNSSNLEAYESRDDLSLYEQLDYLSLTRDDASVAFYGDINIEEAWAQNLIRAIEENTEGPLEVADFSHPDLDSYELMIRRTGDQVNDFKPDVLLYGLPALPDKIRDIGLADTDTYMSNVLNQLAANEDMEVILIEPYVHKHEIGQLNSRSLDYRSYLNTMRDLSEERGLTLLPLHTDFSEQAETNGLSHYYVEAENELNEAGNELVTELLDGYFSHKEE